MGKKQKGVRKNYSSEKLRRTQFEAELQMCIRTSGSDCNRKLSGDFYRREKLAAQPLNNAVATASPVHEHWTSMHSVYKQELLYESHKNEKKQNLVNAETETLDLCHTFQLYKFCY